MHTLYLAYKATKMDIADIKRGDASLCSAGNTKLLQKLSCMHISPSFLGHEAKVPQSRGGSSIQRGFPTKILNRQLI